MKKRIISIMGGGERGIDPCCCLAELERQTGKRTRDVIDFIGGTSTGAALAAVVAAGVPASEALKVYTEQGPRVFSPINQVEREINLVSKGHLFNNKVLHQVILDTLAGSKMLINDSPIGIMITAADQNGDCWYFVKDAPTNKGTTGKASLVDVATASCCATTYHYAWEIPGFGWFADGGTAGQTDPLYETMVEAFSGNECYGSIDPADAIVVSLGTGWYKPKVMPAPPKSLLAGIKWVTGSLIGSSKTLSWQAANRMWPGIVQVFSRELASDIDEADVSNIPQRVAEAQAFAAKMDWAKILQL